MFFRSKQLIGLDLGTNSIKLALLDVSKGKARLEGFYFAQTPPNAMSFGEVLSPPQMSTAIGSLITQSGTKSKDVCASIWGSNVMIKKIQVPKMDLKLLAEQIKFEAEQYIPFNLDDVNIEYHVLQQQDSTLDSLDVLLIAAKKEIVLGYAESIESAGLNLRTIDITGFALSNAFEFNYPNPGVNHIGLLNIGSSSSNFVARLGKNVTFVRDIQFGGKNYTSDIENKMSVSTEEADNLKFGAVNEDSPPEIIEIIEQTNVNYIDELMRTIEFYYATTGNKNPLQKIYISGGGSLVPGLKNKIEETLQAPVENFNPFINISFNPSTLTADYIQQITPYAPLAIGLGLRKVGDGK